MDGLFRKQLLGMAGAVPAIAITILVLVYVTPKLANWVPIDDGIATRLAFATKWMLLPGMTLFAGIFGASRRGFFADAIEGTRAPTSHSLEINLRYNQNTVEQLLVAAIGWLGLSLVLPVDQLPIIAIMAILFFVGRVTFWIGYLINPMGRAFGMTLTAFPTIIAYGILIADAIG